MMAGLKTAMKRALVLPGVSAPFRLLVRGRAIIFMMHRFRDPETGMPGHDPAKLRAMLAHMRKQKMSLLPLHELFTRMHAGEPVHGALAFTIDDGYRDQGFIGGSVFSEFDCPVTTFLTTGFIDGKLWFWWDKIDFIFKTTRKQKLETEIGGRKHAYHLSESNKFKAQSDFTARCKEVTEQEKLAAIERLGAAAELNLPAAAPRQYQPLSWDEVRSWEKKGMTFGPHTTTHPVLARATAQQSAEEISGSWQKLQAEVVSPVPVFCYPNGRWQDFGPREIGTLQRIGMKGAVVGTMGYAVPGRFRASEEAPYKVQRFDIPEDTVALAQLTHGVERLKQIMRGEEV